MTLAAAAIRAAPAAAALGEALRQAIGAGGPEPLCYWGDDVAAAAIGAGAAPRLLIGIDPRRIRVGPVIGGAGPTACCACLSFWLRHNRPDAALWDEIEATAVPPGDWPAPPPLALRLIERAARDIAATPGAARILDVDPVAMRIDEHRWQPAPDCGCGGGPAADDPAWARAPGPAPKRAPDVYRARPRPGIAALRQAYVDYRLGLVRHMYRDRASALLPLWGAESKLPGTELVEIGFGRNDAGETAEAVAVLEALERYCGLKPEGRPALRHAAFAELRAEGTPALDPASLILCDPAQRDEPGHRLTAYRPDLRIAWVWGWSWRRAGPVMVPVQAAFYHPDLVPRAERFVIETSNGCALGNSYEEALFHGLLEAIERDAYMTRWHVQGRPARIRLDDPEMPAVHRLHARVTAEGYRLTAFDIGLELPVPTVLAMIEDPRPGAGVASYCASGAHPVAAEAVYAAMVEVCSSIGVYQPSFAAERPRARALAADASLVQEMRDHVLLYSAPEAVERLAFLDRDGPAVGARARFGAAEALWRADDLAGDLDRLATAVLAVADDIVVVDQRAAVLAPFGLACVKVLVPGLHPVTFGHQYRRISDARLASARRWLAGRETGVQPGRNPHPHNFP